MGLTSSIQSSYSGLVFQPPRPSYNATSVTMVYDEGQPPLSVRWMPCPHAVATIIYSHGNATDLGHMTQSMRQLGLTQRCNVLLWDYPGYGCSEGTPSEQSVSVGALRIFHYYRSHWARDEPIILMGYSLGSGPTCYLASELSKKGISYQGVVLEAPLASVISTVLPEVLATSSMSIDMFTNKWTVENITAPVYILHGLQDSVIPWTAGQTLSQKVPQLWALRLIPGADHNDLQRVDSKYTQYLHHFISYVTQ